MLLAEVADFDLDARELHLRPVGAVPARRNGSWYDTLIVAGGSHYSYFGHEEWQLHAAEVVARARTRRSQPAPRRLRGRRVEPNPAARDAWLTFIVVGAGPTGVEMAGQIAELARDTLRRDFRTIDPRRARILLVEAADRVLTSFHPLSAKAERSLERLGVTVLTGRTVIGIDAAEVTLEGRDGGEGASPANAVIWAPGSPRQPRGRARRADRSRAADRAGRGTVEADLTLPGHPEVFAIGDMVRARDPGGEPVVLPVSHPPPCSKGGTRPASCAHGYEGARTVRSATATKATWPRSGRRRRSPTSKASGSAASPAGDLAARPPLVPDRLPESAARPHPLVVQQPTVAAPDSSMTLRTPSEQRDG